MQTHFPRLHFARHTRTSAEQYSSSGLLPVKGQFRSRIISLSLSLAVSLFLFIAADRSFPVRAEAAGAQASISTPSTNQEYDVIRLRWRDILTGGPDFDSADGDIARQVSNISTYGNWCWSTLNKADGRIYLWSDLTDQTKSATISSMYRRLRAMSLAYSVKGSALQNNPTLLHDSAAALDWLYINRYNENTTEYDNWYDWEIGAPLSLNDIMVVLYDQLTTTQVSNYIRAITHFTPSVTLTGANRVWKSKIVTLYGILSRDSAKVATGRDGLSAVFPYVTTGDGFYGDGSFIQHGKHAYNGGYGMQLLADSADLIYLLSNSTWQVKAPGQRNIYRWVYDSFQPFIYNGAMMDMVRGRDISRPGTQDQDDGQTAIRAIIRVSQFAPPADALAYKEMVKQWLQQDNYSKILTSSSINYIILVKNIMKDASLPAASELVKTQVFADMDRVVHLQPGFGFAISMSSSRTYNYESINGENLKGWYTGDGATYLYNDSSYYGDGYWPTVNKDRLPGTTVDTQPRSDGSGANYLSPMDWVGGVSLGDYGSAGMQFKAYNSTLTGKKSWFMFADKIVALGTGIASTDGRTIETTVDNRQLNAAGNNPLVVNGVLKPTILGWSETMHGVSWISMAGNVAGTDVGYYFPQPVTLKALREARTDSWDSINTLYGTSTLITRNYTTLWLDHGMSPSNASYQYVILPGKNNAQMSLYANNPDVSVVENSADAQAALDSSSNTLGINFWNDIPKTVGVVTSDKKASVMLQSGSGVLSLAISDPTQVNTGVINVQINLPVSSLISADAGVTVTQTTPTVHLLIDVNNSKGKTFIVRFSLTAPAMDAPRKTSTFRFLNDQHPVNK